MPGRGARRRLRIGRRRGCRGDGRARRGPRAPRGVGVPGGFRPGRPRPGPRPSAVGGGGPRAPPRGPPARGAPPSAWVSALRTCGRRLGAPLPPAAARWAAGTPPPPARARAEVSAAGGRGRGDGDAGAAGRSAERARPARRRRERGARGPGEGGRAAPLPLPAFCGQKQFAGFWNDRKRGISPARGRSHLDAESLRGDRAGDRGEDWPRGSPAAGSLACSWGRVVPSGSESEPSACTLGPPPPDLAPSPSEPRRYLWKSAAEQLRSFFGGGAGGIEWGCQELQTGL